MQGVLARLASCCSLDTDSHMLASHTPWSTNASFSLRCFIHSGHLFIHSADMCKTPALCLVLWRALRTQEAFLQEGMLGQASTCLAYPKHMLFSSLPSLTCSANMNSGSLVSLLQRSQRASLLPLNKYRREPCLLKPALSATSLSDTRSNRPGGLCHHPLMER